MEKNHAHFFFFWYLIHCLFLMIIDFVGFFISYSFLQAHKKAYRDLQSLSWTLQISQWERSPSVMIVMFLSLKLIARDEHWAHRIEGKFNFWHCGACCCGWAWLVNPTDADVMSDTGEWRIHIYLQLLTSLWWDLSYGGGRRDQSRNEYCWAEP